MPPDLRERLRQHVVAHIAPIGLSDGVERRFVQFLSDFGRRRQAVVQVDGRRLQNSPLRVR
jgi:hypothetical protein